MNRPGALPRIICSIVACAIVLACFWGLGSGSLRQWDEALTGVRAREMLVGGDYLTPHFQMEPDFNKPPIYYCLTTLNFRIFGINEFSVRLWSVLFGIGCMALVFRIARRIGGSEVAGLTALLILGSNPHWINKTREGLLDTGLAFGMLAAIYLTTYAKRPRGRAVLAGVCLAFGALTKNPLAIVALLVPLWPDATTGEPFVSRARRTSVSFAVFLLLTLSWYVYEYAKWGPAFLEGFISHNIFDRVTTTIEGHRGGPFFFLQAWAALAPVSLALFAAAMLNLHRRERVALHPAAPFVALAVVMLALISAASSKRDLYLMLVYPFSAIATATLLFAWWRDTKRRSIRVIVPLLIGLIGIVFLVRNYTPRPDYSADQKKVGLYLRQAAAAHDEVIAVDIPSNVVSFYAQHKVDSLPLNILPQRLAGDSRKPDAGRVFLVVKSKSAPNVTSLKEKTDTLRVTFQSHKYSVISVAR